MDFTCCEVRLIVLVEAPEPEAFPFLPLAVPGKACRLLLEGEWQVGPSKKWDRLKGEEGTREATTVATEVKIFTLRVAMTITELK